MTTSFLLFIDIIPYITIGREGAIRVTRFLSAIVAYDKTFITLEDPSMSPVLYCLRVE
jgi:hypothetical protein